MVSLFEHQQKALDKFKGEDTIALFFEMGCGKSLTTVAIAAEKFEQGDIKRLLVVAPNDVHRQWYNDLMGDSVLSSYLEQKGIDTEAQIFGGRGGRKEIRKDISPNTLKILCVNVDTFSTPHKWESVVEWATDEDGCMLVLDEATSVKNPQSKRSQRLLYEFNDVFRRGKTVVSSTKKPCTRFRAVLTGTPVTNGPMDLWSIMEFVHPNYFNRNYYSFMNYFGMHTKLDVVDGTGRARSVQVLLTEKTWRGIKSCETYAEALRLFGCSEDTFLTVKHQDHFQGAYKHAEELRSLLEPSSVFAKLVDCVDMPPTNYVTREVGMTDGQLSCYNSMCRRLIATFAGAVSTAKNQLVAAIRLQQISSGFIMGHSDGLDGFADNLFDADELVDENYDVEPDEVVWLSDMTPKMEALLRDIEGATKPVIVMTRFSAEAKKLYDLLEKDYATCLITGWKTIGSIEGFRKGEYDVMVANTTKIARGHNLQVAHTTLYYSNTFSMELRQQSEFRTFRIGQKNPCTYVDYVSCEIDRTILSALRLKKNLLEVIRDNRIEEVAR